MGAQYVKDQFEWPLFGSPIITPEDFARQYCAEVGLGGEFPALICHAIREQLVNNRLSFEDEVLAPDWAKRPFRTVERTLSGREMVDPLVAWEPEIKLLTEEESERLVKDQDRSSR